MLTIEERSKSVKVRKKVTITLTIETEASSVDLQDALDSLLDNGSPQDALAEDLTDWLGAQDECKITNAEAAVHS